MTLPAHFVGPQYRLADEIPPRACRDILPLLAEARREGRPRRLAVLEVDELGRVVVVVEPEGERAPRRYVADEPQPEVAGKALTRDP